MDLKILSSEQLIVFNDLENISLTASAGSGKTFVIERKYISCLAQKFNNKFVTPAQIVTITYTEKSAAEMRKRILESINRIIGNGFSIFEKEYEFLKFTENQYNEFIEHLSDVKENFYKSNISTIHSFCLKILKENFVYTGLNPDVKINSDIDNFLIFNNLYNKVFQEFTNDTNYKNILNNLLRNISLYNLKNICNYLLSRQDVYYNLIKSYSNKNEFKKIILDYLKHNEELNKKFDSDISLDLKSFDIINLILYFVQKIIDKYDEQQKKHNFLNFQDILFLTYSNLIHCPPLLNKLSKKYKYFIIDEMQDTDPVQWQIVDKILECGLTKIFVVGDDKQSIYKFRGADITVFKESLSKINRNKELLTNRRSSLDLIDFFNNFFGKLFSFDNENYGVKYSQTFSNKNKNEKYYEEIKLDNDFQISYFQNGNEYVNQDIQIVLNIQTEKNRYKNKVSEAYLTAKIIRNLLDGKIRGYECIKENINSNSAAIGVLMRRYKYLQLFERAFNSYDIPYTVTTDRGFFQNEAILNIFNYMKFLIDKRQDINLVGCLRSPLFIVKDTTLYLISCLSKKPDLYGKIIDVVKTKSEKIESDELVKLQNFLKITETLIEYKKIINLSDFIKLIIEKTNYLYSIYFDSNDEIYLEQLISIAQNFEQENSISYIEFIDYLEENINNEGAEISCEKENSTAPVQIMSYFKAKGLQFPVVILPDLDCRTSNTEKIFISKITDKNWTANKNNYYVGLKLEYDKNDFEETDTIVKTIITDEFNKASKSENMRLLYVACTRAINKIIPILTITNFDDKIKYIRQKSINELSCFYEWILKIIFENGYDIDIFKSDKKVESEIQMPKKKLLINYAVDKNFEKSKDIINYDEIVTNLNNIKNRYSPEKKKNISKPRKKIFLNPTKIINFKKCVNEYYFRYILNLTNIPIQTNQNVQNTAQLTGTILHKIFECSNLSDIQRIDYNLITDYADNYAAVQNIIFASNEKSNIINEIKIMIDNFLESEYISVFKDISDYKNEYKFYFESSEYILTGIIDKIIFNKNKIIIIDYKTAPLLADINLMQTANEKLYNLQLGLYNYAVKKLFGRNEIETYLIFLKQKNRYIKNSYTDEDSVESVIQELIDFENSAKKSLTELNNKRYCKDCQFKNNCKNLRYAVART